MMHTIGNVISLVVVALLIIAGLVKRFSNAAAQSAPAAAQTAPVPPRVTGPAPRPPAPAPATVLPLRRRLAAPAAPVLPPRPAAAPKPAPLPMPVIADTFPAEAAAAFEGLDLSLPDAGVPIRSAARCPRRTIGSAAVLGSRGWGVGAIVAMEVLGPPLAVRPGATLGASHAL